MAFFVEKVINLENISYANFMQFCVKNSNCNDEASFNFSKQRSKVDTFFANFTIFHLEENFYLIP